jgi:hypothetical protein
MKPQIFYIVIGILTLVCISCEKSKSYEEEEENAAGSNSELVVQTYHFYDETFELVYKPNGDSPELISVTNEELFNRLSHFPELNVSQEGENEFRLFENYKLSREYYRTIFPESKLKSTSPGGWTLRMWYDKNYSGAECLGTCINTFDGLGQLYVPDLQCCWCNNIVSSFKFYMHSPYGTRPVTLAFFNGTNYSSYSWSLILPLFPTSPLPSIQDPNLSNNIMIGSFWPWKRVYWNDKISSLEVEI